MIGGGMSHRMMWGKRGCPLPQNFPGLSAWYRANDTDTLFDAVSGGSNVTTNGDPVARWEDKSGSGYHLTQSDIGKRPTLKTNAKNGKNAIEFDGIDDFLTTGLVDLMRSKGVVNCFIVVQDTNVTGGNADHYPIIVNAGGNARLLMGTRRLSVAQFRTATRRLPGDTFRDVLISPSDTNFNIISSRLNYSAGGFVMSVNSRLPVQESSAITSGNTSNNQGQLFVGNIENGSVGSNFNICEIMFLEDPDVPTGDATIEYLNCIFSYFQKEYDITP